MGVICFFFFKQKTAYEIYQCDWSSDVCSSDLHQAPRYFGIRFIAFLLIVAGVLTVASGVVVIGASVFVESKADKLERKIQEQNNKDQKKSEEELEEIRKAEVQLRGATDDEREMFQDRLDDLRLSHDQAEEGAREDRRSRAAELWQRKATATGARGIAGVGWLTGLAFIFSGIVTIGIGQIFAAFRDMAINSFLVAGE